nr:hypothetical protein [Klebsiella pneumoniae subsp. pneumoniae]
MAEQLLMAAAGDGEGGFIPFATTYAAFATRRAYDFIHQVIAEEHLNVKICAALPGLTTGYGPSHQATEDLAIMRGIPGMVIVDPCDALEIEQAVPAIADHQGRCICVCCAVRCRWCWINMTISSNWVRRSCWRTATMC